MATMLVAASLLAPVLPPTLTPVEHYLADWEHRVTMEGGLTPDLIEEYRAFDQLLEEVHRDRDTFTRAPQPRVTAPPQRAYTAGVEQWRTLVEAHFQPADVPWAMRVMACESGGDPYAANPRSSARGLFQFLRGWWSGAWGYPAFDPFDPEANIRAAAWLYYTDGPQHWVCK
jgi:soluble lytic murein transglycosylase-like protein